MGLPMAWAPALEGFKDPCLLDVVQLEPSHGVLATKRVQASGTDRQVLAATRLRLRH